MLHICLFYFFFYSAVGVAARCVLIIIRVAAAIDEFGIWL